MKVEILRLEKRDAIGNSIINLDLEETARKLEAKKIFVNRDFNGAKPVGIVESIEVIDDIVYANINLFDESSLEDEVFAFSGIGKRKKVNASKEDFYDVVLDSVGLLDKSREVPYLEEGNV